MKGLQALFNALSAGNCRQLSHHYLLDISPHPLSLGYNVYKMPNPRLTKKQRLPLSAKRRKNRGENLRRWREEHTGKNNISLEASNESQPESITTLLKRMNPRYA
ncbi:hypothetical protein J6590_014910 [Homalodisca vitripennis]|nr:hypothetical protein J6590_014910 [Homalodisca vitripennis]